MVQGLVGGLVGNVLGRLGGIAAPGKGARVIGRYQRTFAHEDWWDSSLETDTANHEITCTAGQWVVIGRYQVKPRQRAHFGYGIAGQDANQGYMYLAIYDDTATNSVLEEGKIRLTLRSYDNFQIIPVAEFRTEELRGSTTLKTQMKALPEQVQFPWVGEDSYLCIEFCADATDDVIATAIGTAAGADVWNIPVTVEILAGV